MFACTERATLFNTLAVLCTQHGWGLVPGKLSSVAFQKASTPAPKANVGERDASGRGLSGCEGRSLPQRTHLGGAEAGNARVRKGHPSQAEAGRCHKRRRDQWRHRMGDGRRFAEKEAHGEFESEHPGYCGAQDTFYVGNLKGVGRIYQQTFIDTYAKVGFAKLYDRKTPITAADLLNDRVLPFFDSHEVKLLRTLTDRGSEYCGNPERHDYGLSTAIVRRDVDDNSCSHDENFNCFRRFGNRLNESDR